MLTASRQCRQRLRRYLQRLRFTGSSEIPGVQVGQNEFEGRGGDDVITGNTNVLGHAADAGELPQCDGCGDGGHCRRHGRRQRLRRPRHVLECLCSLGIGLQRHALRQQQCQLHGLSRPIEGRGGDDYIDGRGGYDIVTYNNDVATTSGITVHLAAGTVTGDATVGTDTLRDVEAVAGHQLRRRLRCDRLRPCRRAQCQHHQRQLQRLRRRRRQRHDHRQRQHPP